MEGMAMPLLAPVSSFSSRPLLALALVLVAAALCRPGSCDGAAAADRIRRLPGQPEVSFGQYSGYVGVDDGGKRALFYYFVEADVDPASKPLVLWLNGGPGCSSLGVGAFSENGPFRPSGQVLVKNEYSWNKEANVIYLETPAGVGYSYSADAAYYQGVDDKMTAMDNMVFLQRWLQKFPQYKGRELYIAGESYAGHYIPQLAEAMVEFNKKDRIFNLRGIALGNPVLEFTTDFNSRAEYFWSHGLISDATYRVFTSVCNYSRYVTEYYGGSLSPLCARVMNQVTRETSRFVDKYDVTLDVCLSSVLSQCKILTPHVRIPAIVARSMMMKSNADSIYLPIVARRIQSAKSAISASSSEGADFLIVNTGTGDFADVMNDGVGQHVKIPIFFTLNHLSEGTYSDFTSRLLQSGASGVITSLAGMQLLTDDLIKKDFTKVDSAEVVPQASYSSAGLLKDVNNVMVLTRDREKTKVAGFTKLDERVMQLIEIEKPILNEAIAIIRKAAPMMEEVELLVDAASRLSEPFLLVTVGEFNSGKSTFINALLGRQYLQEGVVPTTNEITLLSYSEVESESFERCERHPDGQFMCYLSVPILKEMNLVDTPGTNVILQRQQRLTEEYVPRADLILFVLSSDRPLTESEVGFLQYVQQWKKKVVFVLNKLDLYRNSNELQEATAFVKENAMKLLNAEDVTLFPVSSRSALEAKLLYSKNSGEKHSREAMFGDPRWRSSKFCELEDYLLSFLDSSTENGKERVRLKLETPIGIADRLLTSCQRLVKLEYEKAVEDLTSIKDLVYGANNYAIKLKSDSNSWQNQISSLIERAKGRAVTLMESTLQLSNIDLIFTYTVKGKTGSSTRATSFVQNDILSPTLDDAVSLLGDYSTWLSSSNTREAKVYLECFCERWDALVAPEERVLLDPNGLVNEGEKLTIKALDGFNASAAAMVFEEEIREVAFGTFGGLGIAGLSASLLTSVLSTTLEDLLALALCSAGGFFVLSSFPGRRKLAIQKVNKAADELSRKVDEAIQKDISQSATNLIRFVEVISKPYQEACQRKIDWLQGVQGELSAVERKLQTLKVEIQNLHGS